MQIFDLQNNKPFLYAERKIEDMSNCMQMVEIQSDDCRSVLSYTYVSMLKNQYITPRQSKKRDPRGTFYSVNQQVGLNAIVQSRQHTQESPSSLQHCSEQRPITA
ncbi:hypothetical protein AVEN_15281-1 [Araneus ventricosus]|uniref:Uncharacterized protein n=1 Tax=Araneus ventricosus TaxID=182803 RepID=A0A4Y2MCE7_ARAVE|nr:hypothetical protein AVEN_15281-1 [Araneus ventricosus]